MNNIGEYNLTLRKELAQIKRESHKDQRTILINDEKALSTSQQPHQPLNKDILLTHYNFKSPKEHTLFEKAIIREIKKDSNMH